MEFKNKPNTCITIGDKEYWISRSVAIVGMIGFKLLSDGKVYFPIQIRGSKMTNRGCACMPCGYIDYNETIEKCLIREFWEETGIDITQYKVIFGSLDKADHYVSDPNDSDVQNISFTFEAILECEKLPELIVSEESVSLNWMTFNELQYINSWAFNHKNKITKYVSIWEARKVKVQAQAETLRGVIDSNKGLIDIFSKEYDALKTEIDAVAAYNKGLTDTFIGEVQGFGEVERAVSARNDSRVRLISEQIKNAEMTLRAAIASVESAISGYTAESSIKEKFSNDIAQIIAHVIASMMSAVHVGATAGYSGSESASKSIQVSAGVHESHNVEHDPSA